MSVEIILSIVFGILSLAGVFVSYYFHIKSKITKAATESIDKAEVSDKTGEEKFKEAVDLVMALIPTVAKPFFSRKFVENIVQMAFDSIKSFAEKQNSK